MDMVAISFFILFSLFAASVFNAVLRDISIKQDILVYKKMVLPRVVDTFSTRIWYL